MVIKTLFLRFFIICFFLGCGYKPATVYTSLILGDNIYVNVTPDIKEPRNTLYIKDAFREVVLYRLNAQIANNQKEANTILNVKLDSIDFAPIQYDKQGYTVAYKATVKLNIEYKTTTKQGLVKSDGTFDFPVDSNSIISENKKNEAIKIASTKAITKFISKMSSL